MKSGRKKLLIGISALTAFYAVFFISLGAYIRTNDFNPGIRGGDGFGIVVPSSLSEAVENKTLASGESFLLESKPYVHAVKAIALDCGEISSITVKGLYGEKTTEPYQMKEEDKMSLSYVPFNGNEDNPLQEELYYHRFSFDRSDIYAIEIANTGTTSITISKALFLKLR